MKKNEFEEEWLKGLRKKAEEGLKSKVREQENMSRADLQKLTHELQVYQMELEMQNEELRATQVELQESRDKYFDFYDLSPTGYLTLDSQGRILENNLTFSLWTGIERSLLVKQPLILYIDNIFFLDAGILTNEVICEQKAIAQGKKINLVNGINQ